MVPDTHALPWRLGAADRPGPAARKALRRAGAEHPALPPITADVASRARPGPKTRGSARRNAGRPGPRGPQRRRIARDSSTTGISPTATIASDGSAASPRRSSRAKL